jgi:hypothetical protein
MIDIKIQELPFEVWGVDDIDGSVFILNTTDGSFLLVPAGTNINIYPKEDIECVNPSAERIREKL